MKLWTTLSATAASACTNGCSPSPTATAGLVDYMHLVVVPILLGRGVRLWDGLEGIEKDYEVEATSSPSGVTHVTFTR